VTPEITALPASMGGLAQRVSAKAGGLADLSAELVSALCDAGADVHVALLHYRRLFGEAASCLSEDPGNTPNGVRIHLAEDRLFHERTSVYGDGGSGTADFALVFQREVINQIMPRVQPDVVHCHDWTTGLIPAFARRLGTPCLFTLHSTHTYEVPLPRLEECGIDAAQFWQHLCFTRMPHNYEESRHGNLVEPLASAIFAAQYVNTVSPTFLHEIVNGAHDFIPALVREEMRRKYRASCAVGILNAPPRSHDPRTDRFLCERYGAETQHLAKRENKRVFQEALGLDIKPAAPLFFWPSRLDPNQKGCELLSHILHDIVSAYRDDGLQVAIVADGPAQSTFLAMRSGCQMARRVGIAGLGEWLSHLGYAAADFVLVPSRFEPCGLPQMVGPLYGALAVVRDTGGLHDAIKPMDIRAERGNGFLFGPYTPDALRQAIDQAMAFHRLPASLKRRQIARVMVESQQDLSRAAVGERYLRIYEQLAKRPLADASETHGAATQPAPEGSAPREAASSLQHATTPYPDARVAPAGRRRQASGRFPTGRADAARTQKGSRHNSRSVRAEA
jgi:ADP-glucose type glycogen/starch synthase